MEILVLGVVVLFIIIATVKFKMHPIFSLTLAAMASGFLLGIAPNCEKSIFRDVESRFEWNSERISVRKATRINVPSDMKPGDQFLVWSPTPKMYSSR